MKVGEKYQIRLTDEERRGWALSSHHLDGGIVQVLSVEETYIWFKLLDRKWSSGETLSLKKGQTDCLHLVDKCEKGKLITQED